MSLILYLRNTRQDRPREGTYHTVTYHPNAGLATGGTSMNVMPECAHRIYDAEAAKVSRYGYQLIGWALKPDETAEYVPGDVVIPTGNVDLYAVWLHDGKTYYTVAYHANAKLAYGGISVSIVPEHSHIIFNAANAQISYHGHQLEAWAIAPKGAAAYEVGVKIKPADHLNLYAIWKHDNATKGGK